MVLTDLRIQLDNYGPNKGRHSGHATFRGETGAVTLKLSDHHIKKIFATCADSIVENAQAAATLLTRECIEARSSAPALAEGREFEGVGVRHG